MSRLLKTLCFALLAVLVGCQSVPEASQPEVRLPERIESRVAGPERVFSRPVTEIVPQLQGARPSGPNGRVGNELAFWGYELGNGEPAYLVGCAVLPDVDCSARTAKVCESGRPEVLFSTDEGGEVRFLNCQAIAIARPGDIRPNCVEKEEVQAIAVTLLSCQ